jgi:hypothetical protein
MLRTVSLLVLLLAAALAAGSTAPTATAATPPASASSIRLGLSLQMYDGRISSTAQAQRLARAHSVISMRSGQLGPFGPAMHAANPNLRLYVYLNGMYAQAPEGKHFPKAWYMNDRSGHRIRSRGWGNWLMDPRQRAPHTELGITFQSWGEYVAQRCRLLTAGGQFDGCFLDMLGSAPLWSGYNERGRVPSRGSRGLPFSAAQWFKSVTGPVAKRASDVAGVPVYGNGIGSGARYYGGDLGPSRLLLGFAARGDAETWLRTPGESIKAFPGGKEWRTEVQMISDSSAAGRPVNATVKTWVTASESAKNRWRRYGLASFLIGNRGHGTFEFSASEKLQADETEAPIYDIDLGAPRSRHADVRDYARDGVYRRGFENGVVIVNAGTKTRTVRFSTPLYSLAGKAYSTLSLRGHDAAILLRSAS